MRPIPPELLPPTRREAVYLVPEYRRDAVDAALAAAGLEPLTTGPWGGRDDVDTFVVLDREVSP
jgi:hypothetical protein